MTATTVDPRVIAESLAIGTDDLARMLTTWSREALPQPDYDRNWEPTSMVDFDNAVDRARNYLLAAHEAQTAWEEDNPEEPEVE